MTMIVEGTELVWPTPERKLRLVDPTQVKTTETTGDATVHPILPGISPTLIEGLPSLMLDNYVTAACKHAVVREEDPGVWVAYVVGLDGAWVDGDSPEQVRADLPEVVRQWVIAKRQLGADDMPVVDGLDVNPSRKSA